MTSILATVLLGQDTRGARKRSMSRQAGLRKVERPPQGKGRHREHGRQSAGQGKVFANRLFNKGLASNMYRDLVQLDDKKPNILVGKWTTSVPTSGRMGRVDRTHTHTCAHTNTIQPQEGRKPCRLRALGQWREPGREREPRHGITYMWDLKKPTSQQQRERLRALGDVGGRVRTSGQKVGAFRGRHAQLGGGRLTTLHWTPGSCSESRPSMVSPQKRNT